MNGLEVDLFPNMRESLKAVPSEEDVFLLSFSIDNCGLEHTGVYRLPPLLLEESLAVGSGTTKGKSQRASRWTSAAWRRPSFLDKSR